MKTLVILELDQQAGAEELSGNDRLESAVNMLKAGGFEVGRAGIIGAAPTKEEVEAMYGERPAEDAPPVAPYYNEAKLEVGLDGKYLDVKTPSGTIASFEAETVRKVVRDLRW